MASDPTRQSHQEWLGYVQPVGVVVSTPALLKAGAAINRNFVPLHRDFLALLPTGRDGLPIPQLTSFRDFATNILGWKPTDLKTPPESFTISISGYEDILNPTYVVSDGDAPLLLVQELTIEKTPEELDLEITTQAHRWKAAPQMRFERLLRETGVPAGLLIDQGAIRLVYAPKGESSGHITFRVSDMVAVAGRPILAALHMLLCAERLFTGHPEERLPAILAASRKHQNEVSTKLSRQVMEALFELLRGFQSAHDQTNGTLLAEVLRDNPNQVYAALLTVLLRLVFVLYAEDRDLLSSDGLYVKHYSVNGLFESLREDQGRYADTMDARFGAWARLLTLFRIVYQGAKYGGLRIPGRKGYLFDPDRFPFLEGRPNKQSLDIKLPRVSDGVLYRVLSKLLILGGERLSYRSLDVEQIGSVYEAMMGFELHVAQGPAIAIKPKKPTGAPVTINLEELLAVPSNKRNEWLSKATDQKLSGTAETDLKQAQTIDDLMAALERRIAKNVTSDHVPKGSLIFQPSPERRRSGSHYTPRSLTAPIVEATLEPVLKQLGSNPTPNQILALKVCDPAMGSGAFLVEACRQLGDALVDAWHKHKLPPILPPDEDELLHARRMIAQRCLYGVDRNEMAVDLAKLSLWLATLARDHEFTFLNHALRHGDSLVGLSARQIAAFHWEPGPTQSFLDKDLRDRIRRASDHRSQILSARDDVHYEYLAQELTKADEQIELPRMAGDVVMASFFEGHDRASRKTALQGVESDMKAYVDKGDSEIADKLEAKRSLMRKAGKPIVPFHWEIEFPEVFQLDANLRAHGGFDAIVGNPPFAGKNTLIDGTAEGYVDWLKTVHEGSHGNSDLVAHFFRRAFNLLRAGGCFGLIATNTIGQGDTRSTGLRWICTHGGTIYQARKRRPWPGQAAVIVSVVHVSNGKMANLLLDGRSVSTITSYLFHAGGNSDPSALVENKDHAFIGPTVLGMGFTFDDTDRKGIASPIALMKELIARDPKNQLRIFPYIGGEEVNDSPTHAHHRYIINFEDFPRERSLDAALSWNRAEDDQRKRWLKSQTVPLDYPGPVAKDWPELFELVETKVRPDRIRQSSTLNPDRWWMFARPATELRRGKQGMQRVFVSCLHQPHWTVTSMPGTSVFSHALCVFAIEEMSAFAILQSRIHETWGRFFGSSMKDDLRYTPTDCFETFPFPISWKGMENLDWIGKQYYEFRSELMIRHNEGLTKTYNRFHSPVEHSIDIKRLRDLHDGVDRAVLDRYGWSDIRPVCEFFPEFEDDEDGEERESSKTRIRKYRYRWPDEIHDEVLARLLALNQQRAAVPQIEAATSAAEKDTAPKTRKSKKTNESNLSLFEPQIK